MKMISNRGTLSKSEVAVGLGKEKPTRYLHDLMKKLITDDYLEYTLPEKPISRLQKYRLTSMGKKLVERKSPLSRAQRSKPSNSRKPD